MRKFTSYGSPDPDVHYHAPREKMIEYAYHQLVGDNPAKGGHYITVWAPRQTGKSWAMLEVIKKIRQYDEYDVGYITMQSAKEERTDDGVLQLFVSELRYWFGIDFPDITSWRGLPGLFTRAYFSKPLILYDFLRRRRGRVWSEFPTGNGKIDLLITYKGRTYGVEVKSFSDDFAYREALEKAAACGKQLGLPEITPVFFVERVDDASREKYEKRRLNKEYGVTVVPVFLETEN